MLTRVYNGIKRRVSGPHDERLPLHGHEPGAFDFPEVNRMSDEELSRLNELLPWSSWVVDANGRRFGNRYTANKRNNAETIPDHRITGLHQRYDLTDKSVLEIGCFEGNHTAALCSLAESVVGIDSRIEHVVKTLVRCSMAGLYPRVHCVDVEQEIPDAVDLTCDVMHHVGVLYHLEKPVEHLRRYTALVGEALMLDTHVAPEDVEIRQDEGVRYWHFDEHGRDNPFAGMYGHAKWIVLEDLVGLLKELGFADVDVAEQRAERSGPRVLIYANR
ncbi:MAG: tRNA 5-methoxyuridine(34)/uridine 5-oxyacetic acid(34) synthase CmoB [Planctomycetaceae bacterium]|nr:tRNA 5-methoxyuridine(34)/uridine 5-oxyacetic acid(34) synthase CmoB [Planctomycetaceae bacterium]